MSSSNQWPCHIDFVEKTGLSMYIREETNGQYVVILSFVMDQL